MIITMDRYNFHKGNENIVISKMFKKISLRILFSTVIFSQFQFMEGALMKHYFKYFKLFW